MKRIAAIAVGLLLAALPFLLYGSKRHSHVPHLDHAARHGGQLFMLGDHHLELVTSAGRTELFLSDASRRPLGPASGSVTLDGGEELALRWQDERLAVVLPPDARAARYRVIGPDGTQLVLPAPGAPIPPSIE